MNELVKGFVQSIPVLAILAWGGHELYELNATVGKNAVALDHLSERVQRIASTLPEQNLIASNEILRKSIKTAVVTGVPIETNGTIHQVVGVLDSVKKQWQFGVYDVSDPVSKLRFMDGMYNLSFNSTGVESFAALDRHIKNGDPMPGFSKLKWIDMRTSLVMDSSFNEVWGAMMDLKPVDVIVAKAGSGNFNYLEIGDEVQKHQATFTTYK